MVSPHLPARDSLRLLLTLSAIGSLAKTALVSGLGQPAVTARVQRVEALVGVSLVDRSPRGSTQRSTSHGPPGALLAIARRTR